MTAASVAPWLVVGAIAAVLLEAGRRRDVAALVNAAGALLVALAPWLIEAASAGTAWGPIEVGAVLPLWVAIAGLVHAVGMLGPYDSVWWWDHLAHATSASLLAALVYAGLLVIAASSSGEAPGSSTLAVVALLVTMLAGVCWELLEIVAREAGERLDVEPVLVHYGLRDTALDLVFDAVGPLLVLVLDLRVFVPVLSPHPDATRTGLAVGIGALVVGTVGLSIGILLLTVRDVFASK